MKFRVSQKYKMEFHGWDTSHPATISKKIIILIYHYLHTVLPLTTLRHLATCTYAEPMTEQSGGTTYVKCPLFSINTRYLSLVAIHSRLSIASLLHSTTSSPKAVDPYPSRLC